MGTSRRRDKVSLTWTVPFRVNRIVGSNVYEVENPVTLSLKEVHAVRLRYYDGKQYEPTEEVKRVFILNGGHLEVEGIVGIRINKH